MTQPLRSEKADKALDKLINEINKENIALAARLKAFFEKAEAQGLVLSPPERSETCSVILKSSHEKDALNFGCFGFGGGKLTFRNYGIALRDDKKCTIHPHGEKYLRRLAALLHIDVYLSPKKNPFYMTVKKKNHKGWAYASIEEVIDVQDEWLALIHETLAHFSTV